MSNPKSVSLQRVDSQWRPLVQPPTQAEGRQNWQLYLGNRDGSLAETPSAGLEYRAARGMHPGIEARLMRTADVVAGWKLTVPLQGAQMPMFWASSLGRYLRMRPRLSSERIVAGMATLLPGAPKRAPVMHGDFPLAVTTRDGFVRMTLRQLEQAAIKPEEIRALTVRSGAVSVAWKHLSPAYEPRQTGIELRGPARPVHRALLHADMRFVARVVSDLGMYLTPDGTRVDYEIVDELGEQLYQAVATADRTVRSVDAAIRRADRAAARDLPFVNHDTLIPEAATESPSSS